jgi:hypothetical protein
MLAITAALKAFIKQAKTNHLNYCKKVVEKSEKTTKKEDK